MTGGLEGFGDLFSPVLVWLVLVCFGLFCLVGLVFLGFGLIGFCWFRFRFWFGGLVCLGFWILVFLLLLEFGVWVFAFSFGFGLVWFWFVFAGDKRPSTVWRTNSVPGVQRLLRFLLIGFGFLGFLLFWSGWFWVFRFWSVLVWLVLGF